MSKTSKYKNFSKTGNWLKLVFTTLINQAWRAIVLITVCKNRNWPRRHDWVGICRDNVFYVSLRLKYSVKRKMQGFYLLIKAAKKSIKLILYCSTLHCLQGSDHIWAFPGKQTKRFSRTELTGRCKIKEK